MFDVFQNVLFGKKKSNGEAEKDKPNVDPASDFVMIGNEQASNRDMEHNPSNPYPKNPYGPSFLPDDSPNVTPHREKHVPIMPLQDVPFTINSGLYASEKLDQIWQIVARSLASIGSSVPYQEEYDFSLEKSVIAEISNK